MPALPKPARLTDIPNDVWDAIAGAVAQAATVLNPASKSYGAERNIIARFIAWRYARGLPLETCEFSATAIDAYVRATPGANRKTVSILRRVGRGAGVIEVHRGKTGRHTPAAARPYSPAEIEQLFQWATFRQSETITHNKRAYLALSLGAGLTRGECDELRWTQVIFDDHGVMIRGVAGRDVPVIDMCGQMLSQLRTEAHESSEYVVWPRHTRPASSVVGNTITGSAKVGLRPTQLRLRDTWVVAQLSAGVPAAVVMNATGLKQLRRFRGVGVDPQWHHYRLALHQKSEPVRPQLRVVGE